jgi:hypothetical protein
MLSLKSEVTFALTVCNQLDESKSITKGTPCRSRTAHSGARRLRATLNLNFPAQHL